MQPFFAGTLEPMLKGPFICGSGSGADNRGVNARHAIVWARAAGAALLLLAAGTPIASADGRDDHERARAAVQAGEMLPLPALLERLQRTHPGQVLELELEREDGRWIYEVKLLQADGQLLKLAVDAHTAQVLEARRKDGGQGGRRREPPR